MLHTDLSDFFKVKAQENREYLLRTRRHLHENPELSFKEIETSAYLANELELLGYTVRSNIGGYGLTAFIDPQNTQECIVLRADMDALPIFEETGLEFASKNPGVMHACGHDSHSAMLLTVAKILKEAFESKKITLKFAIQFIFQPAEEKSPGGAQAMIRDGAFTGKKPRAIIGQHIHPGMKSGQIGTRPGSFMAAVDDFTINIVGKGGHGASPNLSIDPISISAHVITALQTIVSRSADPQSPTVLSFGSIHAGSAHNIIPDRVTLLATLRTFDPEWRIRARELVIERISFTAQAFQASAIIELTSGYPTLSNDEELAVKVLNESSQFFGPDFTSELPRIMWAEDFAYYSEIAPSCFYNLGVSPEPMDAFPLHSSRLFIDEDALVNGVAFMAYLAYSLSND